MNKPPTAIVTGVTGQMGSYFADFLLAKGFTVIGTVRRLSVKNHQNVEHCKSNPAFTIAPMDLGDPHSINALIERHKPDYFINCAANSFVGSSWDYPEQHIDFNMLGVLRQLEAIKRFCPTTRYINFGSSEEFGDVAYSPQDEKHPARARSPYGASKIGARQIVKVYRESFNLFAIQCWCFNYESPRRGHEFVTRKITLGVARICHALKNRPIGQAPSILDDPAFMAQIADGAIPHHAISGFGYDPIELGNLDAKRDWSHAKDFVEGIWLMLNQAEPREYVLASGETHTIREFVQLAFREGMRQIGRDPAACFWDGLHDKPETTTYCYRDLTGEFYPPAETLVRVNPAFYRPAEVSLLWGSAEKVRTELGWTPKHTFPELVREMVQADIATYVPPAPQPAAAQPTLTNG